MNSLDASSESRDGSQPADLASWLVEYRERLRRAVVARIDPRVSARIDPSDVLQEASIEAARRFERYRRDPRLPPFLWLRFLALEKLLQLHRFHLGARARDAGRERSLDAPIGVGEGEQVASAALAVQLAASETSPSDRAAREERRELLETALDRLSRDDRDVIALRHYERLTSRESALVLEIGERAASQRYVRAMKRLRAELLRLGLESSD